MSKTTHIIVKQPANDGIGASLSSLLEVISLANNTQTGDKIHIDLSNVSFIHPTLILPLALIIKNLKSKNCLLDINYNDGSVGYLNVIDFPSGWNPKEIDNWQAVLTQYNSKTYIPILAIPCADTAVNFRDETINVLGTIIRNQIGLKGQLFTAISYMLSETFDNIVEHAKIENGWVMIQNYPNLNYLDICVADRGQGILNSYLNNNYNNIQTHEQAINEAINGLSTKNYEGNRGYGIRTSRRMLVDGLGGNYFMYSGNAFYIWNNKIEKIASLDEQYNWRGTFIVMRIPKVADVKFKYTDYLES